jgi:hypothetical protein
MKEIQSKTLNVITDIFMLLLGIGLGALYWILDSIAMALLSRESEPINHLFSSGIEVAWQRTLEIVLLLAIGTYTNLMIKNASE